MAEEVNYFWLNCGYTRWNHNEPLVGQITLFESGAQFNPTQGFRAFKKAKIGDQVIFYQVQNPKRYILIEPLFYSNLFVYYYLPLNIILLFSKQRVEMVIKLYHSSLANAV